MMICINTRNLTGELMELKVLMASLKETKERKMLMIWIQRLFPNTMICINSRNLIGVKMLFLKRFLWTTSFKPIQKKKAQLNSYLNNTDLERKVMLTIMIQKLFPNMTICTNTRNLTGVLKESRVLMASTNKEETERMPMI
jgi:hypothetical protein